MLASWDAGVIGYYSGRHVINLDGVANSYAYYQAARDGRVGKFLTDRGVAGLVNLGTPLRGQDPSVAAFVRSTLGATAASQLRLARVWPFTYSGSTDGIGGLGFGGTAPGGVPVSAEPDSWRARSLAAARRAPARHRLTDALARPLGSDSTSIRCLAAG